MIAKTIRHFELSRDDHHVVTVWISHADRSTNVIDDEVLFELELIVDEIESDATVEAVVFRSGNDRGFLAGADVNKIAEVAADDVDAVLVRGQKLFRRIEQLSPPTLAAIEGPCLGGGLEFALACRHRIARDSAATRLGLPEVRLGVIPGWGGTQRLPWRVGLTQALPMILKGSTVTASAALRMGLVDRIATDDSWDLAINEFVTLMRESPTAANRLISRKFFVRLADQTRFGRALVLRTARKRIADRQKHYPALTAAIRAVAAAFDSRRDGYAVERQEFARLMESRTCRNLLAVFLRRERARNVRTWRCRDSHDDAGSSIQSIGIVGSGAMGAGIAGLAALKGFPVVIKEVDDSMADQGLTRIAESLDGMVHSNRLPRKDRDACMNRVVVTSDWARLREVDLVIEAVFENEQVKRDVFENLDRCVKPSAMLATNTSSLSVQRMAEVCDRAGRVAGLHFFNPVDRMDLVEVVRAKGTDDATTQELVRLVRQLGKTPIVTTDTPGFLVNRVLFPYVGEAMQMVVEGYHPATIDDEIRKFGMPMGPLELLDHIGIDVARQVSVSLGSIMRENGPVVALLDRMVSRGWTGRKGERGFYRYMKGRRAEETLAAELIGPQQSTRRPTIAMEDDGLTDITRRVVYPMINESVRCLQEHVVSEPWMVDLAMVLGTGFAPFRGGPLSLAESIGWKTISRNLQAFQVCDGARFEPTRKIFELAINGETLFAEDKDAADFNRKTQHAACD